MATQIKTTGEITEVVPANGSTWSLKELQDFVGGYIEIVRLPASFGQVMVVNEEGLLYGLAENPIASLEAKRRIVGDVIVCDGKEID